MSPARSRPARIPQRLIAAAFSAALAASTLLAPQTAAAQAVSASLQRVNGSNAYELAVNVAGGSCDSDIGSHSVALASGEDWPDALAGAALDRPLLLTRLAFLPAVTKAYLEPCASHADAKVIILGGPTAVSDNVAKTLDDLGYRVDRITGADRYDTARRAARAFAPASLSTVYLASGVNAADAVAIAPSVAGSTPLILTPPGALGEQARRFLTDASRQIASVTILGGHAAVSAQVEAEVAGLGIETSRIAGADRYETAALIARRALGAADCDPVTDVAVASGTVPLGGLAAGAVRGPCEPLLLAPGADSPVPTVLSDFGSEWLLAIGDAVKATVTGIGPSSVVPTAALAAVASGVAAGTDSAAGDDPGLLGWDSSARSVVQIRCVSADGSTNMRGSGFVVGNGRQIVTNHHVVFDDQGRSCRRLRAHVDGTFEQAPPRSIPVTVQRSDETRDLALLTMAPGTERRPAMLLATEPLRAGETIVALGYPEVGGDTMTFTAGRYSGLVELNGATWIKTDTPVSPGSSGGPMLNSQREIVGVATLLQVAVHEDGGFTVGSLGLLSPVAEVAALLAGDIGD